MTQNQAPTSIKNIPEQDYHSHLNMKFKIVRRKEKFKNKIPDHEWSKYKINFNTEK